MKQQLSYQKTKSHQYYLNHSFTIIDLQNFIQPYQSFRYQNKPIEINLHQNFTFLTIQYSFQLYRRPQNQLRIFYFALLSTIYQTDNILFKDKIQQSLLKTILQNFDIILPFKNTFKKEPTNISKILTTNQIKSSFVKFLSLLYSSNQKSKIVLIQIIKLPQIDFVLMSIFQMYFSKSYQTLTHKLEKIKKDFGLNTKIIGNGFQIQDFQFQIIASNQQNWQQILVKKIYPQVKIKKQIYLKRRGTTQSIGQIQQDHLYKSQEQVNQGLNCQQLINARFVQSCQSENFFNLQNQTISQEIIDFVWNNQTPQNFISPHKNLKQTESYKPQMKRQVQKLKKTTFLTSNNFPCNFKKSSQISMKKMKLKTTPLNILQNNQNFVQRSQPRSPQDVGTQKQIKFKNTINIDKIKQLSKETLSTKQSQQFQQFSKFKQFDSFNVTRSSVKKFSERPKLQKSESRKFFLSSVTTS